MKIPNINTSIQHHFGALNKYNKTLKNVMYKFKRKERNKLFVEDVTIIFIEKTKESTNKLLV